MKTPRQSQVEWIFTMLRRIQGAQSLRELPALAVALRVGIRLPFYPAPPAAAVEHLAAALAKKYSELKGETPCAL